MLIAYRGYSYSEGEPTEEGLQQDAVVRNVKLLSSYKSIAYISLETPDSQIHIINYVRLSLTMLLREMTLIPNRSLSLEDPLVVLFPSMALLKPKIR